MANIFERIGDITSATLNDWLEQTQDPMKAINQYLYSQKRKVEQAKQLYYQCERYALQMKKQWLDAHEWMEKREEQAQLALKAGEEKLARLALQEKIQYEEKAEQYKKLYEQAESNQEQAEQQLISLQSNYNEVWEKREIIVARMQSVKLQQQIDANRNQVTNNEAWFHRLEDKVMDMEMEAGAMRKLAADLPHSASGLHYFEHQKTTTKVDAQLEMMKEKLQKEE
ncbi:PspA/IM30 family protein [Longirhabdus pacifica]|uniref:PspA/IM30 family protein n=1 Tax=Longirhabdus pacifica TaxID=2305227 RepID=UPI0013E8D60D|nr:PspA/IM30 family protein [Longirhabdus pacifica]